MLNDQSKTDGVDLSINQQNKRNRKSYENLYSEYIFADTKAIHTKQLELSLKGGCKSLTIIIDKFVNKKSCALNEKGNIIRCDEF